MITYIIEQLTDKSYALHKVEHSSYINYEVPYVQLTTVAFCNTWEEARTQKHIQIEKDKTYENL